MKFFRYVILFIAALLIISCGKDPNDLSKMNEQELLKKAEELYQQKNVQKTVECFQLFIQKFPKNERAPEVLKNLAAIYGNDLKDLNNAVLTYKKIFNEYPESKEAPNALFTLGFIYSNDLKDINQAKTCYEQFLQKYPNHEAAPSAKFELENLGKSTEEVLNKLIKDQNK